MKYYAITEMPDIPIHIEPKLRSKEEVLRIMDEMKRGIYFQIDNPKLILPQYMTITMSEETYKFISSVANIYSTSFGEKEYEINKIKFQIFTEEEYELRYGKLNEELLQEDTNGNNDFDIKVKKSHFVELYNFAYDTATKTGDLEQLHQIDLKLNGN